MSPAKALGTAKNWLNTSALPSISDSQLPFVQGPESGHQGIDGRTQGSDSCETGIVRSSPRILRMRPRRKSLILITVGFRQTTLRRRWL